MESDRFDALVRTFGQTTSRRKTLLALAGAAVGALASGGRGPAAAQGCKADGKACKKNSQCCSGTCAGGGGGSTGQSEGRCSSCPPPPPTGPDRVFCRCNDGTELNLCVADIDCLSTPDQDAICVPQCACRGGVSETGCQSNICP
jgi:hypothetical protein